jgi:hypothetical protein
MSPSVITISAGFSGLLSGSNQTEVCPGVGDNVITFVAELAAAGGGDIKRADEDHLDFWADQVDLSADEVGWGASVFVSDSISESAFVDVSVLSENRIIAVY